MTTLIGKRDTMSDELVKRLRAMSPVAPVGDDIRLLWEQAADRIEALEADKDELLEEVSRLRHGNQAYEGDVNRLMAENARLTNNALGRAYRAMKAEREAAEAENARLRKILDQIAEQFGIKLDYELTAPAQTSEETEP